MTVTIATKWHGIVHTMLFGEGINMRLVCCNLWVVLLTVDIGVAYQTQEVTNEIIKRLKKIIRH
ncbi:hypothetical protein WAX46_04735 [Bacillus sp. FJAT-53060]|uniref:hypothetical protein n=1 Tax=Bacillus TaxID=1386 RepID=UPI001CFAAB56|nr:hypothetical protein [Bacillus stratosphericus]